MKLATAVDYAGDRPGPTTRGRHRHARHHQRQHAVLEFETTLSGRYVNGVDEQMRAMVERMSSNGG
jgi:hypothetical protein